jgi:hypothetical protein
LGPDTCLYTKSPNPKLELIDSRNYAYITFDHEVILSGNLDVTNIKVEISGPAGPY